MRYDATAEHLHSLSTRIDRCGEEYPGRAARPDSGLLHPRNASRVCRGQADRLGLLKEFEAISGGKIRLNRCRPRSTRRGPRGPGTFRHQAISCARQRRERASDERHLPGDGFTRGSEEFVIPFFDRGLPVEYELMRSIRVVSRAAQKGRHPDYRRQDDRRIRACARSTKLRNGRSSPNSKSNTR